MAVGTSETDDEQVGIRFITQNFQVGNRDARYFVPAQVVHQVMVLGVGGDAASFTVLLQSAEDVRVAFRAGDSPVACQCLRVALVRTVLVFLLFRCEMRMNLRELVYIGQLPS